MDSIIIHNSLPIKKLDLTYENAPDLVLVLLLLEQLLLPLLGEAPHGHAQKVVIVRLA